MALFPQPVIDAFKAHAIRDFPNECCGVVTAEDGYVPLANIAPQPTEYFTCTAELAPYLLRGTALALAHSHPNGPEGPSELDMRQQAAQAIPWGILMCNAEVASEPWWWGDSLPVPPLIGREFRHGPSGSDGRGDCYALIRDYYRAERGISLIEVPRTDNWWLAGKSLYESHFADAGFVEADKRNPLVGDVLLMRYPGTTPTANHGGVYIGDGQFIHHLSNRVSRMDQIVRFDRFIVKWLRHAG